MASYAFFFFTAKDIAVTMVTAGRTQTQFELLYGEHSRIFAELCFKFVPQVSNAPCDCWLSF